MPGVTIGAAGGATIGRYALGIVALLLVGGSLSVAAVVVRRRFFPGWASALARLSEVVIGFALLTGILEVLGTVGLFRRAPIVAACVVLAWVIARVFGGTGGVHARAARVDAFRPFKRSPATPIALLAAAAVTADWAAPTIQSYNVGILSFDSLWYHLPWAASFAQTGHITPLRFTDIEYLTAFYPATAELVHGLGIVLLGRDTLSPALNLVWLGLVLLAGYCVGRSRGVGAMSVVAVALAMAMPMFSSSQGGTAANDVVGVFFLLASVALLLASDWRAAAIAIAAVSAGLAITVKLSLLVPVAALSLGVIAIAPAGRRRRFAGLWLGPLVLAGCFWYVRNLFAAGNPLPWSSFGGLLSTPAPPLQQHTAFAVAHYLGDARVWSHVFGPGLRSGFGPWWPAVLVAAVLGPLLCLAPSPRPSSVADRTREPPLPRMVQMLGLVALASSIAYLLTPETAAGPRGDPIGFAFNLRYAAPALALSLTLLPLAPVLEGRRRQAGALLALLAVLVATLAQEHLWPSRNLAGALGVGLVVAVAALLVMWQPPRGRTALAAVAGLALAGVVAGYPWQQHYLRGRYAFHPHISDLAPVWALFRGVHHARIGMVGTYGGFFSYPLDGVDASNRVQYIGQRSANGSFEPISSCRRWRAAIDAGHYRYVVTTPARDPWNPQHLGPSPEGAWTASDRAARIVYRRRAAGQPVTVFELSGPLDPAGCPAASRDLASKSAPLDA